MSLNIHLVRWAVVTPALLLAAIGVTWFCAWHAAPVGTQPTCAEETWTLVKNPFTSRETGSCSDNQVVEYAPVGSAEPVTFLVLCRCPGLHPPAPVLEAGTAGACGAE
jgi:hypothetical protein